MSIPNLDYNEQRDDWVISHEIIQPERLNVKISIFNEQDLKLNKEKIAHELAQIMLSSDFISFEICHDSLGQLELYGSTSFLKNPLDNYIKETEVFSVNGTKFSNEEIREALINTFPEKII